MIPVRPRLICIAVALLLFGSACRASGTRPRAGHVDLGEEAAGLVSAFNADAGKVRAIFIASPT